MLQTSLSNTYLSQVVPIVMYVCLFVWSDMLMSWVLANNVCIYGVLCHCARRSANRNPEWWGDFSRLVKIEKLTFLGILRYKFELRFWLNLKSFVSRSSNSNPDFGLIWICSWLKSPQHSGFRFAFRRACRVSFSKERAVPRNKWC